LEGFLATRGFCLPAGLPAGTFFACGFFARTADAFGADFTGFFVLLAISF